MKTRHVLLAICVAGCTSQNVAGTPGAGLGPPASVHVASVRTAMYVGETLHLSAEVLNAASLKIPDAPVTWSSDRTDFVSVSTAGDITAVAPGAATITARSTPAAGSITITVLANPPALINIIGVIPTIEVGRTYPLTANVLDATNHPVPASLVTWESGDPSVITVTANGVVQAVGIGTVTIMASVGDVHRIANITSRPSAIILSPTSIKVALGDSLKLTATAVDIYNTPVPNSLPILWSSSLPENVSISAEGWAVGRHGAFPAGSASASITASIGGVSGQVDLSVASFSPGLAGLRFVHAASEIGQLNFLSNKTPSASLKFGDIRDLTTVTGNLSANVEGFAPAPTYASSYYTKIRSFLGLLAPAEHLTLYAMGDDPYGMLEAIWDTHEPISSGNVLVRILYASNYSRTYAGNNIHLLPVGAPIDADPILPGVDQAGAYTEYELRAAGNFDIVVVDPGTAHLAPGNFGTELVRFHITPRPGHATTYVIAGKDPASMRLLTVEDP